MKPFLTGIVLAILIAASGGFARAQQTTQYKSSPELQKSVDFFNRVSTTLNLTDEQKNHFKQILIEIAMYHRQSMQSHQKDFAKFKEMFKGDTLDAGALKTMADARADDREKMEDFTRKRLIEFHDLLTPAQRTTAVEKLSDYFERIISGDSAGTGN